MRPPDFWRSGGGGIWPAVLWPASRIVAAMTARRVAQTGWRAPVPVICCGNAGMGGAGKTTLVLDLATRLQARGLRVHLLTRGHGGQARGTVRVNPAHHDARAVGDEALLLAACAPTWMGADRGAAAKQAVAAGAQVLIMDDGLQNATLVQDCGLLVVDGAVGFGNGRVLPGGPLREPVAAAAERTRACVLIGRDATNAGALLPPGLPVLAAELAPGAEIAGLVGTRVLAFAGIGRPAKFFDMLAAAGLDVAERRGFPDHHRFQASELARITVQASRLGARVVTTPKDFARIPADMRAGISAIGVSIVWQDEQALECLLGHVTGAFTTRPKPDLAV